MTLEADVGADLAFNGTSGLMDVNLDLGDESIRVLTSAIELVLTQRTGFRGHVFADWNRPG